MLSDADEGRGIASIPAELAESGGGRELVRAGFIPLVDCAPLVVAARLGFAAAEGIEIELVRQTSWASLRDRLAVGHFDAAQMLAPMPIAANLGIGGLGTAMVVPMALSRGGNAITLSRGLWADMQAAGAAIGAGPAAIGAALKAVAARSRTGLTLGTVHPFSTHSFALRYWLAASGIDPDRDVRLAVVPPPYAVEALESGQVDGFCVGEPWNNVAAERGSGVVALTVSEIWAACPCKVLGLRRDFAARQSARVLALVRAVRKAGEWANDPDNRPALADLLSAPDLVGVQAPLIERSLAGRFPGVDGAPERTVPGFIDFSAAATHPRETQALWFYSQMVRWGQVRMSAEAEAVAVNTYRPDIARLASGALVDVPRERRWPVFPDGFFDGRAFDPNDIPGYLAGF